MFEFSYRDHQYRVRKIDTFVQFNILSRVGPIVTPLFGVVQASDEPSDAEQRAVAQVNSFLKALREMSDDERKYVCEHCLSAIQRKQSANGAGEVWTDFFRAGRWMYEDMDNLRDMLQMTAMVLRDMLADFLSIRPGDQIGSAGPLAVEATTR